MSTFSSKIKTFECPHCGSTTVSEQRKWARHSSGEWNELLSFTCGYSLHYSPNFDRVEENGQCKVKGPALVAKENLRLAVGAAVTAVAPFLRDKDYCALNRALRLCLDNYLGLFNHDQVISEENERDIFEAWISEEAGPGATERWPTPDGPSYKNDRVQDYRMGWVEALKRMGK